LLKRNESIRHLKNKVLCFDRIANNGGNCAALERVRDKCVSVMFFSLDGEEYIAGVDGSGIDAPARSVERG
jgi:hypothetical protein